MCAVQSNMFKIYLGLLGHMIQQRQFGALEVFWMIWQSTSVDVCN